MYNQISKAAGVGLVATLALAVSANNVQAFDFPFSFDNATGSGDTPGTVEGIITGLNEGTGAADSVLITSFPSGLGSTFDEGNDAVLWTGNTGNDVNSFTVSSGIITDVNFISGTSGVQQQELWLNGFDTHNYLSLNNHANDTWNQNGFSGVSFSAAATPVPFGVSTDLSLIILGGLYGASRLRKKFAASK